MPSPRGATKPVGHTASFLTSGTQRSQPVGQSGFTGTANSFCSLRTLQTSPIQKLVLLEVRAFLMIYAQKYSSDFSKLPFTHSVHNGFFCGHQQALNLGHVELQSWRGRNQGTSERNLFLQLFSGEYVFAPSSSQKGCLFQHTDNSRGWICSLSNHFPKHHGMVQQVKLLTFCRNQVEPDSSSMPWKLTLSLLMCQHRGWNHHHVMTHLNCGSKQSL